MIKIFTTYGDKEKIFKMKSCVDRKEDFLEELNHIDWAAQLDLMKPPSSSTKWYDCARCDAGYPDQDCTCVNKK